MAGGAERRTGRHVWLIVGLLALAHMMAFVDQFAMSAVAGQLKGAFGLSETALGALQGLAIALPAVAVIMPLGRLADRMPPWRLILAGIAAWTVGGFACAFSTSLLQLAAARALIGVGQAAFAPAGLALLGGMFGAAGLPRPLSVFTAGSTLGKSVALLASGLILRLDGAAPYLHGLFGGASWREVFALTAAPNLLLILAFALLRPAAPKPIPASDAPRAAAAGGRVFSLRFLTFALIALAPLVLIQAAAAWTPVFYVRYFHLAASQSAFLLGSTVLVAGPLGYLAGGQLTTFALGKGVGPARLVAACLAATAPLGAIFCLAPSLAISLAAYGLAVVLLGMAALAGFAGVSLVAPPGRLAAANAAYLGLAKLAGVGLGPTIVGLMSDAWFGGGAGLRWSLIALFLALPPACLGIVLACERLWRRGGPEESGAMLAGAP